MSDLLVRAAMGERTSRPPVWLMRQAGRHLPEYRDLRSRYTFTEAVTDPAVAEEISLQPWERYRPDGVVMFSDILVALEPLDISYRIEDGVGPVIDDPVSDPADLPKTHRPVEETLSYVGDLLGRLAAAVGDQAAVIGFAGGPFTLASYAVSGTPAREHVPLRRLRAADSTAFAELLDRLAAVVSEFLEYQVAAGADVVQLFDTYAGLLPPAEYAETILPLHRRILADVSVPTIVFVRGMGGRLDQLAATGADVVGLDWTVGMADARETLGETPVQGNLDPTLLLGTPARVRERTREIIDHAGPAGHILNLGHGVHRDTPVENVQAFVETAKAIDR